jgi:hypothetical protein
MKTFHFDFTEKLFLSNLERQIEKIKILRQINIIMLKNMKNVHNNILFFYQVLNQMISEYIFDNNLKINILIFFNRHF